MEQKNYRATLLPGNRVISCAGGETVLDALADAGVFIPSPCGGRGICGKCGVAVTGELSPPTNAEEPYRRGAGPFRLACQARVAGDLVIHLDALQDAQQDRQGAIAGGNVLSAGIAVDIGTTSIQISLVDRGSGSRVLMESFLNPQRRFGQDVISRIAAARDAATAARLTGLLRTHITLGIGRLLASAEVPADRVRAVVFAGNTVMLSFLFGRDTTPLGQYPYAVADRDFAGATIGEILPGFARLAGNDGGAAPVVAGLPAVSAYLGGDFLGGLGSAELLGYRDRLFFIDLGTNGEMGLVTADGKTVATSCAMGPALEGMNIACGMLAGEGAITHCWVEEGSFRYQAIGEGTPRGISGTGIIDALAVLLEAGIVLPSGVFNRELLTSGDLPLRGISYSMEGNESRITLAGPVYLSQKDVRTVQLARGACRGAAEILLTEAGIDPGAVRHVVIAGAFGEHLRLEHFRRLGFLPDFWDASYVFSGNTSLRGAEQACVDPGFVERLLVMREGIRAVELSVHPGFNDRFLESVEFK